MDTTNTNGPRFEAELELWEEADELIEAALNAAWSGQSETAALRTDLWILLRISEWADVYRHDRRRDPVTAAHPRLARASQPAVRRAARALLAGFDVLEGWTDGPEYDDLRHCYTLSYLVTMRAPGRSWEPVVRLCEAAIAELEVPGTPAECGRFSACLMSLAEVARHPWGRMR